MEKITEIKEHEPNWSASTNFVLLPVCYKCKYFAAKEYRCPAFPGGIPVEIETAENDHSEIFPGQVGDYVFTPK